MPLSNSNTDYLRAALLMLAVIQVVMLTSLHFGLAPHPPRTIPLFAMAPFLAVSIGVTLCAMQLVETRIGKALAIVAALAALLSYGPQKYVDPAFAEIWIAVIAAQVAVVAIFAITFLGARKA